MLRGVPSAHFGRPTAKKLVLAAQASSSSSRVLSGRESLLYILCDQLEHTQAKRTAAGRAVGAVDQHRSGNQGLQQIPELGLKSVAVLRAELGEVDRFARTDQAVAYVGMDVEIKESGKFKGKAKLSKRGSGLLRQIL